MDEFFLETNFVNFVQFLKIQKHLFYFVIRSKKYPYLVKKKNCYGPIKVMRIKTNKAKLMFIIL